MNFCIKFDVPANPTKLKICRSKNPLKNVALNTQVLLVMLMSSKSEVVMLGPPMVVFGKKDIVVCSVVITWPDAD